MRLMERRGWILVALPILTLIFTYLHIDKTVHIDLSKPSQITRAKATMEEKRENRRLAKQYAWVAFGWRGREWSCLESLLTTTHRTHDQALSELLSCLEREVENLNSKYCEAYVTLISALDLLVRLGDIIKEQGITNAIQN
jgi:hypothetical protein